MRLIAPLALVLLSVGCGPSGDDSGLNDDPPIPRGRDGDCGDNNPVIEELTATITDPDLYETTQGVQCLSTVTISIVPFDEDGDLDYYLMDVWWDETIDGRVLAEGPFQRVENSLGEACEVTTMQSVSMRLGIGGSPPHNTEIEFGAVLEDSAGNRSDDGVPQVVSLVTPPAASPSDCE